MEELLRRALEGIDLSDPDAPWRIFRNLMALVPWHALAALTVLSVVVAWAIAWLRGGRLWKATLWALLLGPLAWPVVWALATPAKTCPRCGRRQPLEGEGGSCCDTSPPTSGPPASDA